MVRQYSRYPLVVSSQQTATAVPLHGGEGMTLKTLRGPNIILLYITDHDRSLLHPGTSSGRRLGRF